MAGRDYTIPDTNILIKKGVPIFIPVYSIHHDAVSQPTTTTNLFIELNT